MAADLSNAKGPSRAPFRKMSGGWLIRAVGIHHTPDSQGKKNDKDEQGRRGWIEKEHFGSYKGTQHQHRNEEPDPFQPLTIVELSCTRQDGGKHSGHNISFHGYFLRFRVNF